MANVPDIAKTAKLLADSSRAVFLNALMEVDGLPASALAQQAGITLQTASSHLHQLVEGQLIKVEQHGRHKYYRLASVEVAQVIEALSALAPKPAVHSFNSYSASQKLRKGRSCYDHLAGALGVTLTDYFVNQGYLIESNDLNYEVTFEGMVFFTNMGIDLTALQKQRRQFARRCLDWSERRYHLAGSLGHAVMHQLITRKWIVQQPKRVVSVTELGAASFQAEFGLTFS